MKPIQEEWFSTAIGTKFDPDGHYGLQCVDLVDAYAQHIFGVPWQTCVGGVNGARDLMRVAPEEYWIKIYNDPANPDQIPERGDVFVFDGDYLNQFGHTGAVSWADVLNIGAVQQDGFALPHKWVDGALYSDKPAHFATLGYYQLGTGALLGWLRPRPEKVIGDYISPAGEITTPKDEFTVAEADRVIQYLKDVLFDGYDYGNVKNPGLAHHIVTIPNIPSAVWKTPVTRDGNKIIALQELADAKTIGLRVEGALKALQATVDGLDDADPAVIKEAVSQGLSEAIKAITTVTTVTTKDPK